jgi:basic amino acid/polyamine antiporter, APA family
VSEARRRDGPALAGRARDELRRRSDLAGARVVRGLGEPALFAITLSAVVAGLYVTVGVVAEDALGLTPVVFLVAGLFLVATLLTYIEGSSLHVERGGASSIARYAFNEFWSFVAGWAILLDYMIVMAGPSPSPTTSPASGGAPTSRPRRWGSSPPALPS